ncbi:transposase, MuDR, MULE transposase domain protein [Tanacetum coccineum]
MSSSHHKKFKVHLVCLESTRAVLLPKEINYGKLVSYCKQKFDINNTYNIKLSYKICSDIIDLCDDDDLEVFINDILSSNDLVAKIFIKLSQIDGARLKGIYLGTNLLAVGMDAHNQIMPLTTGVAQSETVENWSWFLTKLKECISDVPNLAIISDRHYSITIACRTVFPQAFHGFCCCHLLLNCNFKSKKHKAMYWKTCKAYLKRDFEMTLSYIRGLRLDAYRKLEEAGFDRWSRAYCPSNRYNYMTSNSVESINSLTKHVRKVPITMLMKYYRELIQRWYLERRFNNEDEPPVDELSRWAAAKVSKRNIKSANWIVTGIEHLKMYHVKDHKAVDVVDLSKGEYSCRKWKLSGFLCGNVCALSKVLNMSNSNRWAKAWFLRRTLKATYQQLVYPLRDVTLWVTPNDLQVVLPPALVKPQPGQPKNKARIRSQGEEPRFNRCSRCSSIGHNRNACREPLPSFKCVTHPESSNQVNTREFYDSHANSSIGYGDMHLDDFY